MKGYPKTRGYCPRRTRTKKKLKVMNDTNNKLIDTNSSSNQNQNKSKNKTKKLVKVIKAITKASDKTDKKNSPKVKAGDCIFPFKTKGKVHYECVESSNPNWRKWCATSIHESGARKGYYKTFGYCTDEKSSEKIVNQVPEATKSSTTNITDSGQDSLNPKIPLEVIYANSYDEKEKFRRFKSLKAGKCIFPFKFKNEYYGECVPGPDGEWCATSVDPKTKKMESWGFCRPKGELPKPPPKNRRLGTPKKKLVIKPELPWIAEFMSDADYKIIKTNPNGNCFFESIQKATGVNVKKLREICSDSVTDDTFTTYNLLYQDRLRNNQMSQINQTSQTSQKGLDNNSSDYSMNELAFMKDVDNILDLKEKIKTKDYWADEWSISIIEKSLNIKTCIFNKYNFVRERMDNVINCGGEIVNSDKLITKCEKCNLSYEEFQKDKPDCEVSDDHKWVDMDESDNEDFKPSHYVMLSYDGSHYDLISYKDNKKLVKLPEKLFKLFYQKCVVEKKFQGQFSKIKEFREFKE
jgi:hypothetical protein